MNFRDSSKAYGTTLLFVHIKSATRGYSEYSACAVRLERPLESNLDPL